MDLAINKNDIKVWTFPIADYPIRGFKASTVVKSSLGGLVNLILDTERAPEWVFRTQRIDLLEKHDTEQTFLIRVETSFPWPLKDRDMYVRGQVAQDPQTLIVHIDSESTPVGQFPERSQFVRMPDMQGHWEFRPLGKGQVEVIMSGRAHPGGAIPEWAVSLVIQETPYQTLKALRKMVSRSSYQDSPLPQIQEPKG
jgi:hypothetical protein